MSTKVFGVIIYLNDHLTPVAEDTDIGLYNVHSDLASDAASGQKDVVVDDASDFTAGEIVYIGDSVAGAEVNVIDSIAGNTLTMVNNLAVTYTTANDALVDANSRFKWIQNSVTDVTKWSSTMLVAGGIKPYTREIDLRDGGNTAIPGSSEVVIKNTSQFNDAIFDKGVYVNGLRCEIVLFTDDAPAVQWVGKCGNPQWTSKEFSIPLKGMTRAACITTQINETDQPDADSDNQTKAFPVLFGTHSYAKALRISEKETLIENQDMISIENVFASERITVFPITSNSTDVNLLTFTMAIGYKKMSGGSIGSIQDVFVGKYIKVVTGLAANEYRKITAVTLVFAVKSSGLSLYSVQFTVDSYFSYTLRGNETCSDTNQTWVSVIDIDSSYQVDSTKCIGFLGSDGAAATKGIDAYSYYSKSKLDTDTNYVNTPKTKFVSVPNYSIVDESTDHNVVKIDAKGFASGASELKYFDIKTPTNMGIIGNRNYDGITNSLTWWRTDGTSTLDEYTRRSGGVFVRDGHTYRGTVTTTNLPYAIDKDGSSRARIQSIEHATGEGNTRYFVLGYSFDFPAIDDDYEFDGIYLILNVASEMLNGDDNSTMIQYIRKRKWIGYATDILDSAVGAKVDINSFSVVDLPDEYSGLSTNNLYFFPTSDVTGSSIDVISGHKNLEITDIANVAEYRAHEDIGIFVRYHYRSFSHTVTCTLDLYEVAVAFLKIISISESVYVACKGRIFDDTWNGRKTEANLIESPVDALEHVCRLQEWNDNSIPPALGWGRGYAGNALVQTTGEGSFDDATDTNFTSTKALTTAAQFVELGDCYTDKLKRSLCRDFFLANWTNKSGYECVKKIKRTATTIAAGDKLTLASIVDRASIRVTDPDPSHIYAEPFVRYNKNMATGKWDSIIRIKNVSGSWATTNVEGMTGSGAEEYWNRCVSLWNRSHEINRPPSNLTDLAWANGDDAYTIAREYITSWIDWMYNPSITFKTTFSIAGQWEECKRFSITLPHQTNSVEIECLLTGISIDPNPPYIVKIDAIMFSETIPEDFYIKKTIDAYGNDNDWVKTLTAYGDTNDIIKVI